MDDKEVAIECLKIAAMIISPTVNSRVESIAQAQKLLYDSTQELCKTDKPRIGRPPKPREE